MHLQMMIHVEPVRVCFYELASKITTVVSDTKD